MPQSTLCVGTLDQEVTAQRVRVGRNRLTREATIVNGFAGTPSNCAGSPDRGFRGRLQPPPLPLRRSGRQIAIKIKGVGVALKNPGSHLLLLLRTGDRGAGSRVCRGSVMGCGFVREVQPWLASGPAFECELPIGRARPSSLRRSSNDCRCRRRRLYVLIRGSVRLRRRGAERRGQPFSLPRCGEYRVIAKHRSTWFAHQVRPCISTILEIRLQRLCCFPGAGHHRIRSSERRAVAAQ